ncbi:formyl-CoA transferase [Antricoccus suffuscus]|uniref:Formyl-CoA transferase n=1 Tax=Antricoccus suffuscus TaxID=1629062 RepID=A0A2T0ZB23_9ACTN|nr:CoA transferase [Antricoccus suffuscus]PRZ33550.1 formyl-CoA transferase [Antricoccus suffuscus]
MQALDHLTILDMTQVIAGPYCTMMLADMGADVIKIEQPSTAPRAMGYPMKGSDGAGFLAVNRNKRSFVVDLKDHDGRAALLELVAQADVFVENFRPGVTAKLGIDWPTLAHVNPELIYASISGFGQDGPYAQRPGYDLLAQALSGIMSVTGSPDGPPAKAGLPIGDLTAGLVCSQAILTAIIARTRTRRGQYVETSLLDAAISLSVWESAELWATDHVPEALGSAHRATAPYQAVKAKDGYLAIAVNNAKFWAAFCQVISRPALFDDDRFATNQNRMENLPALIVEIEQALSDRTVDEWIDTFLVADIPASPILDYRQSLSNEQVLARKLVQYVEHPIEGSIPALGIPAKLSDTPGSIRFAAPLHGQHTVEVLGEVGMSSDEIDRLVKQGSVFTPESLHKRNKASAP